MADDSRMRWLPPGRGAHAGPLVPGRRLRHPLRRQVAHQPRRPDRPGDRRAAGHQHDDGVVDRRRRARPTSTPTRSDPYGFSGWVGPEPHGAALANSGYARRPADRGPGGGLAGGPLRPPARRRRRRPAAVPARGQLRQPARHRAVPDVGAGAARCDEPSPLDPPPVPAAPDRGRGPARPSRPPRSPTGRPTTRATARPLRSSAIYRRNAQQLPGPLLPAARRGRRPAGPGAPRRHRRRLGRRRAGAHLRPRRPARAPTAACTRSGSTSTTRPPGCRSPSPGSASGRPRRAP